MNLVSISEVPATGTAVTGGVVFIPVMDARFLFHALNELRKTMPKIADAIHGVVERKEILKDFNKCANILQSMDGVLMPVATEIVVPKIDINLEEYDAQKEEVIDLNRGRTFAKVKWDSKEVQPETEVAPEAIPDYTKKR